MASEVGEGDGVRNICDFLLGGRVRHTMCHVGSQFPDQGSDLQPLHCSMDS